MRVVLIGQAPFGAKTLEALLEAGENVVAAYTPPDRPGAKPDVLKEAAALAGIPVFQPTRYRDDRVFEAYRDLQPDLTILAFVTDIIPTRFFEAAGRGAICYHPSLLPRHRGASAINWAVIMGDRRTGLTVFYPDGGIDTGPILLQREIDIRPEDTTGSLYFNHLFPMGVDAIVESVHLIREGKAPRIPQDESQATYEPPCDDRVAAVNWNKPGEEVFNLIRGCDPQPGAFTTWKGEKIRLYGVRLLGQSTAEAPGTIVGLDQAGIQVAVLDGRILVEKVKPATGGKMASSEFASQSGLKPGDRLGAA